MVVSGLLGGGASVGILAAVGPRHGEPGPTSTGLDAPALYFSTSSGVVAIAAAGHVSSEEPRIPPGGTPQGPESTATGTGFVIDDAGYLVTASHVVDGASPITVTFEGGQTRRATLLGQDEATDIALLKLAPHGLALHPLGLGSSSSLDIGEEVAVIGDPFGYERSLSTGIVSGLDRTIEAPNGYTVAHAIQTDAAINPGSSGGPVLDSSGRVVGIADQIATDGSSEQSSGVGFAVPIDLIAGELDQLKVGETVSHAYLGVSTTESTVTTGARLASVTSGSPAADAGLKTGDIVTAIDGTQITGPNDLVSAIGDHKPGDQIELTVRRGSDTHTLTATLGSQPNTRSSLSTG